MHNIVQKSYCSHCGQNECNCKNRQEKILRSVQISDEMWQRAKDVIFNMKYHIFGDPSREYFDVIEETNPHRIRRASHECSNMLLDWLRADIPNNDAKCYPFVKSPFIAFSSGMKSQNDILNFLRRTKPDKSNFELDGNLAIDKYLTSIFRQSQPEDDYICPSVNIHGLNVKTSPDGYFLNHSVEFKTVRLRGLSDTRKCKMKRKASEWFYQLACQQLLEGIEGSILAVTIILCDNDDDFMNGNWANNSYFEVFEVLPRNCEICWDEWKRWFERLTGDDKKAFHDACRYSNKEIEFGDIKRIAKLQKTVVGTSVSVADPASIGNIFEAFAEVSRNHTHNIQYDVLYCMKTIFNNTDCCQNSCDY
jgi:hypothetical protein